MEGNKPNLLAPGDNSRINPEFARLLTENVEGFQQCVNDAFEGIEKDESYYDMTLDDYCKKKAYMAVLLEGLLNMHRLLADQHAHLIVEIGEHVSSCGSSSHPQVTLADQHAHFIGETSNNLPVSSCRSSSPPQVTQMLDPNRTRNTQKFKNSSGFDVILRPDEGGFYLSKGESSPESGSQSSSSVSKSPVPPVIDDALKVDETKVPDDSLENISNLEEELASLNKKLQSPDEGGLNLSEQQGSSDSGSESCSSVNKPPVSPVKDDALKEEETKVPDDSLEKISNLEEEATSLNKKLQSPDESGLCPSTREGSSDSSSESFSSLNKLPVPRVNDDALKVDETKVPDDSLEKITNLEQEVASSNNKLQSSDEGGLYPSKRESSPDSVLESSLSVHTPPVPLVNDDALKVEETKVPDDSLENISNLEEELASLNKKLQSPDEGGLNLSEQQGSSDSGSESCSSVNKPPVSPVKDDALKEEETKVPDDSLEKISNLEEEATSLNKKLQSPDESGLCPSTREVSSDSSSESFSSVNKLPVPRVNDDALKVEETKVPDDSLEKISNLEDEVASLNQNLQSSDEGGLYPSKRESSPDSVLESSLSVHTPPVPPVNDDALKVEETKVPDDSLEKISNLEDGVASLNQNLQSPDEGGLYPSKREVSSDSGSESDTYAPPVNDDALKVKETKVLDNSVEKISKLEEDVASLKKKIQSLTDENADLKKEIKDNISDINDYMSESKSETKRMEEELEETKEVNKKINLVMSGILIEKASATVTSGGNIKELNAKVLEYLTEISELNKKHEQREKIWNGIMGKLKAEIKEKSELADDLKKNLDAVMLAKNVVAAQLDKLKAEVCSQEKLIKKLQTRMNSFRYAKVAVLPSFDNVQLLVNELKLKLVELESEVDKQKEAMSEIA